MRADQPTVNNPYIPIHTFIHSPSTLGYFFHHLVLWYHQKIAQLSFSGLDHAKIRNDKLWQATPWELELQPQ